MDPKILRTADGLEYEYRELEWGDLIEGDKEVLQRMGIGVGIGFPGESGCNKRQVTTTDPRGFPCVIKLNYECFRFPYYARIEHPGREYHDPAHEWQDAFPGVQRRGGGSMDYFKGSAEALTAAGIVPAGMYPGMPGMRSVRVTILADGTLPAGHRNSNNGCFSRGVRCIEKAGKYNYVVRVSASQDILDMRNFVSHAYRKAWEARIAAMPRAPRIDLAIRGQLNELAAKKRAQLHVVWSRPKFVPGFNIMPQGPFAR